MKVFLTGGSQFVGGALLRHLVADGHQVLATVGDQKSGYDVIRKGATPVDADLADVDSLAAAMGGVDAVFHVAGVNAYCLPNTREMFDTNVRGSVHVIRAAAIANVPRVVYTSSAVTVGEKKGEVGSESTVHRGWYLSDYERSKVEAERAVMETGAQAGVNIVSVNPSSVQGPGRVSGTARFLLWFLKGRGRRLPDTTISLVDVDDCARAHLAAATRGKPGSRYLVSGATVTTAQLIEQVAQIGDVSPEHRVLSPAAAKLAGTVAGAAYGLIRRQGPLCPELVRTLLHGHSFDGSFAERELGISYTPLSDTLGRIVAWYRENGYLP